MSQIRIEILLCFCHKHVFDMRKRIEMFFHLVQQRISLETQ